MADLIRSEDDLLRAVWHGAISIEDGVAWGLEHGYPFTVLPASEIAAFKNAAWTIEQAIGWIACRTDDGGARAGALLRYWGQGLLGAAAGPDQRESLSDAKDALWNGLIGGTVTATGKAGQRQTGLSLARVPIPASDFIDLEWTSKGLGRHVLQQDMVWTDVRLSAPDVRHLWPEEAALPASLEPAVREPISNSATKRGRKPDPEVDRFWIEIVKSTSTGQHGSQKALTEYMVVWAVQNDCKYDAETIRKKVGALYREMGWRDGTAD